MKRLLKNWRPISLKNVDAGKAFGKGASWSHFNQNTFVKGGTIFDAVRTIDHVIQYAKYKYIPGILAAQ